VQLLQLFLSLQKYRQIISPHLYTPWYPAITPHHLHPALQQCQHDHAAAQATQVCYKDSLQTLVHTCVICKEKKLMLETITTLTQTRNQEEGMFNEFDQTDRQQMPCKKYR